MTEVWHQSCVVLEKSHFSSAQTFADLFILILIVFPLIKQIKERQTFLIFTLLSQGWKLIDLLGDISLRELFPIAISLWLQCGSSHNVKGLKCLKVPWKTSNNCWFFFHMLHCKNKIQYILIGFYDDRSTQNMLAELCKEKSELCGLFVFLKFSLKYNTYEQNLRQFSHLIQECLTRDKSKSWRISSTGVQRRKNLSI